MYLKALENLSFEAIAKHMVLNPTLENLCWKLNCRCVEELRIEIEKDVFVPAVQLYADWVKYTSAYSVFENWLKENYSQYTGDTVTRPLQILKDNLPLAPYIVKALIEETNAIFGDTRDIIEDAECLYIADVLPGNAQEVLYQIVENPKDDGDVVSKNGKAELYCHGLILRVCTNGQHGANAANYRGWKVWKALEAKRNPDE